MEFHNRTLAAVIVVVASAIFLAPTSTISQAGDDLILELCNKTSYVDTCITTVKENIKGKITGIAILVAEIDAATKGAKVARSQATNLTESASGREKELLSTCKEHFETSIDNLKDAKTAVAELNATAVNFQVNEMVTHVFACDDSFTEASIPSPLIEVDRLLIHLGSNSFVIAGLVGLGVA